MDLASIFTTHWPRFAATHRHLLTAAHYKAARAVMACRTAVLGGEVHHCSDCADEKRYVYHSCNHRSCPKCGGREQKEWAAAQEAKLLPRVPYFMITLIQSPPPAPSPFRCAPGLLLRRSLSRGYRRRSAHHPGGAAPLRLPASGVVLRRHVQSRVRDPDGLCSR